jgi:hypothetical protein
VSDTWLIDANVISLLFEADAEVALSNALANGLSLATTKRVLEEVLRSHPIKKPWVTRARPWKTHPPVPVRDMDLGGLVHTRWRALRRRYAPADVDGLRDDGELTCIAHAAEDPNLVLVSHDRNATWWALHELRPLPRIASAVVFFDMLVHVGALDAAARSRLGALTSLRDHLPTWWSA